MRQLENKASIEQCAFHVEGGELVTPLQHAERMPKVSPPNAIPLPRIAKKADAQSTPFCRAFENGASHLGRHLSEGLQRLTFMRDSSNRHFNDPGPGSSRVDQKADIDAVVVLKAKLAQQTAASRNNASKRLR